MSDVMLLVGGPCDGRRIKADGRPKVYYLPRTNRLDLSIEPPRYPEEAVYMAQVTEEYVRTYDNVYVHHSIRDLDVVGLLTAGYRCEIGK